MQQEIESSLVAKINQAHADCMACDHDIRTVLLAKINKARECGIFLQDAKERYGRHGDWLKWIKDHLVFSEESVQLYIRFARSNPQPVTDLKDSVNSLKDAMIASGALAAPAGHKPGQELHDPNIFAVVVKYVTNFNAECEKQFSRKPIEDYARQTIEQFVDSIEPAVMKANDILVRAKRYIEAA